MDQIDNHVLDELIDVIYQRIEQKFAKQLNTSNVEYAYSGIVLSADNDAGTANVDIGLSTTGNIPNLSGELLSAGDTVKVFADRTNMVGAYIGVLISKKQVE